MPGEEWRTGERFANDLRYRLELGTAVADLRDVMRRVGVIFITHDFGQEGGDGRYVKKGDRAAIVVNSHVQSTGRVRFTIAHELGHHLIHGEGRHSAVFVDDKVGGGGDKPSAEKEADAFAAYFLAPTRALQRDVGALGRSPNMEDVVDLAIRYGVSYQALVYRLNNSGLIGAARRNSLIAEGRGNVEELVRARGGYNEDDAVLVNAGVPDDYRETALRLYGAGALGLGRLAELLRISAEEAEQLLEARGIDEPATPELVESDFDDLRGG